MHQAQQNIGFQYLFQNNWFLWIINSDDLKCTKINDLLIYYIRKYQKTIINANQGMNVFFSAFG